MVYYVKQANKQKNYNFIFTKHQTEGLVLEKIETSVTQVLSRCFQATSGADVPMGSAEHLRHAVYMALPTGEPKFSS